MSKVKNYVLRNTRKPRTPEQTLDLFRKKDPLHFEILDEAEYRPGRVWYVKVRCRHCGNVCFISTARIMHAVGCSLSCTRNVLREERELRGEKILIRAILTSPYNWDISNYWPKTVTWSREKEAYWRR